MFRAYYSSDPITTQKKTAYFITMSDLTKMKTNISIVSRKV
jgi:hypothetical protein